MATDTVSVPDSLATHIEAQLHDELVRIPCEFGRRVQASSLWTGIAPAAAAVCEKAQRFHWGLLFEFHGTAEQLLEAGVVGPAQIVIERKGPTQTFYDACGDKVQTTRLRDGSFRVVRWHDDHCARERRVLSDARMIELPRPQLRLVVDNTR